MDAMEWCDDCRENVHTPHTHDGERVRTYRGTPSHAPEPECSVCETRHPIGTPCADPIHPGPRTVRKWIAVSMGAESTSLVGNDREQAERFVKLLGFGAVLLVADIPITEPATVQARVL